MGFLIGLSDGRSVLRRRGQVRRGWVGAHARHQRGHSFFLCDTMHIYFESERERERERERAKERERDKSFSREIGDSGVVQTNTVPSSSSPFHLVLSSLSVSDAVVHAPQLRQTLQGYLAHKKRTPALGG